MNDIVQLLSEKVGITPEQAQKAVETIAGYVKEKFPMLEGAVDQLFKGGNNDSDKGSGVGGFGNFLG